MPSLSRLSRLLAGSAATAALIMLAAGPALADPPAKTVPEATDIVGVGSDTTQYLLDQLSADYDQAAPASKLYSWDAVNPVTGAAGDNIVTKKGCAAIPRPDGSNQGIVALNANTPDGSEYCLDYARSARGRTNADPGYVPGGDAFVKLATDAITYATRNAASGGTNAPGDLSAVELAKIYQCTFVNWNQAGGANAPILAFLPQTGSGLRTAFLTAIGGGTPVVPGGCVMDGPAGKPNSLQENEGTNPVLDSPNAIVPYSAARYISQVYRSAPAGADGVTCTPKKEENKYGCDLHGVLELNKINGTVPAKPWPKGGALPAPPAPPAINDKVIINDKYTALFVNIVYDVVRYDQTTADRIPAYLEPLFAAATAATPGYACSAPAAKIISAYGFLTTPLCGTTS